MGRLDRLSWADFTAPWEIDVKAGLYWLQAALNLPLNPGSRVLVGSSGAAQNGSPLSGGYADRARRAFEAGCDIALHCSGVMDEMLDLVEDAWAFTVPKRVAAEYAASRGYD